MIVCNSKNEKYYIDLVAAHKGLLKEKKTLETSLLVMSRGSNTAAVKPETEKSACISASSEPVSTLLHSFYINGLTKFVK